MSDETKVYKTNEFEVEYGKEKEMKIPPLPVAFYGKLPNDPPRYDGDSKNIRRRAAHKLYNMWVFWINVRTSKELDELLQREETDKESDAFKAKATIVQMLDQIAKVLVNTNLLEEVVELLKTNDTNDLIAKDNQSHEEKEEVVEEQ